MGKMEERGEMRESGERRGRRRGERGERKKCAPPASVRPSQNQHGSSCRNPPRQYPIAISLQDM